MHQFQLRHASLGPTKRDDESRVQRSAQSTQPPAWIAALPARHVFGSAKADETDEPAETPVEGRPNPVPVPCDEARLTSQFSPAFSTARQWRSAVRRWFESHLEAIQQRGRLIRGDGFMRLGALLFHHLTLLDTHFRISSVIRERGALFPTSEGERVSVRDLETFANASYWIRRYFDNVQLSDLQIMCQTRCLSEDRRRRIRGQATPGSRMVTFCTDETDRLSDTERSGVAMHEAFHASFTDFDHDSYSDRAGYPGSQPMTNADSYATFAAVIATGSTHRNVLPDIEVRAGEATEAEPTP